jgi:hypothetical protein
LVFTLFSLPKGFVGHAAIIQRNALGSWVRLRPAPEVILFGDDPGVAEAAAAFGVRHVPKVQRNEFGTPLVSDLFEKAAANAGGELLCYTNADIIFTDDLPRAIAVAARWRPRFLLAGRRFNLRVDEPIAFDDGWDDRLRARAREEGDLQDAWWIDYFAFPRGTVDAVPAFAIGRAAWDNWVIYDARRRGIPVVDATGVVAAIHQAHYYGHVPHATGDHWRGLESDRNLALAGGRDRAFSLLDASHRMTAGGVRRRLPVQAIRRRLDRLASAGGRAARLVATLRAATRFVSSTWRS